MKASLTIGHWVHFFTPNKRRTMVQSQSVSRENDTFISRMIQGVTLMVSQVALSAETNNSPTLVNFN